MKTYELIHISSLIYTPTHPGPRGPGPGPGAPARALVPEPLGRGGGYINELILINSYVYIKYSLIKYFNWTWKLCAVGGTIVQKCNLLIWEDDLSGTYKYSSLS